MIGETGERKSAVATPDGKSRKKKKKILLTPTSRRQSAAQILTHTNIGPVHTPAFVADDLSLRSIRLVGVSIRRVQFS